MIKTLSIRNYALIEKLDIELFKGLNIITGETGAGKSILLGSLELVMGKRADYSVLYDKGKKCIVEVVYDIENYNLKGFFEENDLDYSDEMIVRRIISPQGKSRAFVNDEPINLSLLRELSNHLIQIHRQFDNLELNKSSYQLRLIDEFGGITVDLEKYQSIYKSYKQDKSKLSILKEESESFKKEMQFLEYQFNELSDADVSVEQFEEMENHFNNLNNAENIKSSLQKTYNELGEGEFSIINRIDQLLSEISNVDLRDDKFDSSKEKFFDAVEKLREVANEFLDIAENTEYDENQIEELKNSLDSIYNLMNKHNVDSVEKLLKIKSGLEMQLQRHFDVDAEMQKLVIDISEKKINLESLAKQITKRRLKSAKKFSKEVEELLKELALPHSKLIVDIQSTEELNEMGADKLQFLFVANKGSEIKPLKDVASGGELSRLALSIEATIAEKMALPTLIFDEIEAGISGEVARKMGNILKSISNRHQLLNITHSPQIAAKSDYHYFVYKKISGNQTKTNIRLLDKSERVEEIAKMLSGDPPTEGAFRNANELIDN